MVDAVVGEAQVAVGVDLQKLLAGLEKAKASTTKYTAEAAKSFLTVENTINAVSLGLVAYSAKNVIATTSTAQLGASIATVSLGLKNMLGLLAQVGTATASFAARNPRLATAGAGFLLGNPVLGLVAALSGTRAGGMVAGAARGAVGAAGFAARAPLAALGIGAAATGVGLLGVAAIGAAAKTGAEGFSALKESFNKARTASQELQVDLVSLRETATRATAIFSGGSEGRARALAGVTGGNTSDFALLAGATGEIRPEVLERSGAALQELALRFGDSARAAEVLGEALRRPARAMELLRDVGITVTADQRRQFENVRLMTDRLAAGAKVLDIIIAQTPQAKKSGFIELMTQLGTALGGGTALAGAAISDALKNITAELSRMSGLTAVLAKIDASFKSIGLALQTLNKRWFPTNPAEELASINVQIAELTTRMQSLPAGNRGSGLGNWLSEAVGALTGGGPGAVEAHRQTLLGQQRFDLEIRQMGILEEMSASNFNAMIERDARLDQRLQTRIQGLRLENEALQARNTSQLEAFRVAQAEGIRPNDPRAQEIARWNQLNEARRRAIAQAGQLSVFERENAQLQQQVQLFRFGNEQMEIRNRLLQIELAAAQRRQPLTDAQKTALEQQMTVLKQIQTLTTTVNEATASLFNSMGDALATFASTGKFKFKEFADSVIQQLVRIAVQSFVIKPLLNAISGFTNPLIAGALSPGSTTSPITIPSAGGFAAGGSFTVPGGGGGDKPFLIGLTPGENVNVTPRNGGGGGAGVTIVNNINSSKDFDVQSNTRSGPGGGLIVEQMFTEVMKKIGQGEGDGTFGARFGMRPRTVRR